MNHKLLIVGCFFFSVMAFAKTKSSEPKVAKAVEVDESNFNNQPLGIAPEPVDPEPIPDLGQLNDSYAIKQFSSPERAAYCRVPEAVREVRETARKQSIAKATITLFDYIRSVRTTGDVGANEQFIAYEEVIKKYQVQLMNIMFSKSSDVQDTAFARLLESDSLLKEAVTFFGVLRVHAIYGDFKNAPVEVQNAQKVEKGFHNFNEYTTANESSSSANAINRATSSSSASFKFSPTSAQDIAKAGSQGLVNTVRNIGLALLWDLRAKLLPGVAKQIDLRLSEEMKTYVPYDRIYIDIFKGGAMVNAEGKSGGSSPEFLAIWRSNGPGKKYRKELLALGLISSGRRTDSRFGLVGQAKGAEGNSPDGIWRVFGFNKYFIGNHQYDMRGMTLLSYGNDPVFVGRGFHLVFFSSPWGSCDSHGCFRVYTGEGEAGLANVIWASINPGQLTSVDSVDFGQTNLYDESILVRELMRSIRERVWITAFSKFEDGMRFSGPATYSTMIRRQYDNYRAATGTNIYYAARKLWGKSQTMMGAARPGSFKTVTKGNKTYQVEIPATFPKRSGQYWVYDSDVRTKMFDINFKH